MKWFKHDTNALSDAKIEKLMMKYGLEGYGFYFACVELIAASLVLDSCEFKLEHDVELLAHKFKKKPEKIQEMLEYCVEIGLLQYDKGSKCFICLTLAKRLDNTLAQSPEIKNIIKSQDFKSLKVTLSDLNKLKPNRIDKNRIDKNRIDELKDERPSVLPKFRNKTNSLRWAKHQDQIKNIIELYNKIRDKKLVPHTENYVKLLGVLFEYGYTTEQCLVVVKYMWKQWQHVEKMIEFHRPETLFAYSNFQKYLPEALEWQEKKEQPKTPKRTTEIENIDPEIAKKKISEIREKLCGNPLPKNRGP